MNNIEDTDSQFIKDIKFLSEAWESITDYFGSKINFTFLNEKVEIKIRCDVDNQFIELLLVTSELKPLESVKLLFFKLNKLDSRTIQNLPEVIYKECMEIIDPSDTTTNYLNYVIEYTISFLYELMNSSKMPFLKSSVATPSLPASQTLIPTPHEIMSHFSSIEISREFPLTPTGSTVDVRRELAKDLLIIHLLARHIVNSAAFIGSEQQKMRLLNQIAFLHSRKLLGDETIKLIHDYEGSVKDLFNLFKVYSLNDVVNFKLNDAPAALLKVRDKLTRVSDIDIHAEDFKNLISTALTSILPTDGRYVQSFSEECILGSGAYGQVVKARNKIDHVVYAVKKIKMKDSAQLDTCIKEVTSMAGLDHPGVVKYYSAWVEEMESDEAMRISIDNDDEYSYYNSDDLDFHASTTVESSSGYEYEYEYEYSDEDSDVSANELARRSSTMSISSKIPVLFIQMEFIEGMSLRTYLDQLKSREDISVMKSWSIFRQLLEALEYIHSEDIVHRDLKPENVMLDIHQTQIKIVDFGLALSKNHASDAFSKVGTALYQPENTNSEHPWVNDIYAAGVILFEIFHNFQTEADRRLALLELQKTGIPPRKWASLHRSAAKIISLCCNKRSDKVPTARQLLDDPAMPKQDAGQDIIAAVSLLNDPNTPMNYRQRIVSKALETPGYLPSKSIKSAPVTSPKEDYTRRKLSSIISAMGATKIHLKNELPGYGISNNLVSGKGAVTHKAENLTETSAYWLNEHITRFSDAGEDPWECIPLRRWSFAQEDSLLLINLSTRSKDKVESILDHLHTLRNEVEDMIDSKTYEIEYYISSQLFFFAFANIFELDLYSQRVLKKYGREKFLKNSTEKVRSISEKVLKAYQRTFSDKDAEKIISLLCAESSEVMTPTLQKQLSKELEFIEKIAEDFPITFNPVVLGDAPSDGIEVTFVIRDPKTNIKETIMTMIDASSYVNDTSHILYHFTFGLRKFSKYVNLKLWRILISKDPEVPSREMYKLLTTVRKMGIPSEVSNEIPKDLPVQHWCMNKENRVTVTVYPYETSRVLTVTQAIEFAEELFE